MILDACVLIAILNTEDVHHERAMELLTTDEPLLMASITMAEALIGPARTNRLAEASLTLDRLQIESFDRGYTQNAIFALATAAARYGLRVPDATVLNAAVRTKHPLATFDRRLATAAREAGVIVLS